MQNCDFYELENRIKYDTLKELEFFNVLDYVAKKCLTEKGRELVLNARPDDDAARLNKELQQVDEMLNLLFSGDEFPNENIDDIRPILHKAKIRDAVLNTAELLKIKDMLDTSHRIRLFIKNNSEKYPIISNEIEKIFDNPLLQKHINAAIDESGEVRDNATKELQRIRTNIVEKSSRLRSRMNRIVKQFADDELVRDDFFTVRDGRYVLPIKAEHKRHVSGIIHSVSQTGATVFLEPTEIIEMNNEIAILQNDEQREIYKILKQLTAVISNEVVELLSAYDILGHLDSLFAKAGYAMQFGGIKPEIFENNEIYIRNIYHPILVQARGKKQVVPLSVDFSTTKRGHLISGPNAGGKTVALKSIGLNILLALSGFFPLGEVKTNFRTVYSAIGDHQSIENDLSTFSSQILKLKQILDVADANSLILIDEICSGTDPREGSALASGILDTFIKINSFFIVTTHQSSLKTYALNRDVIENASLEFDEAALKPTYKFLSGIPGNSYAFLLAKNIGFSNNLIRRAKKYLGKKHREIEENISILQRYKKESEDIINKANAEKNKFENIKKDYENRIEEFKSKKKNLLDNAKIEAHAILQNANSIIENTIREIREEKKSIAESKSKFNKTKSELSAEINQIKRVTAIGNVEEIMELNIGDTVGMIDSPEIGEVLEADNQAKIALIEFNGIKFRLPFTQLYYKNKPQKLKSIGISKIYAFEAKMRLDLHGKRAEEALHEINDFLDKALLANFESVTIVHGKGTGTLRTVIHEYLHKLDFIKSYRLGNFVEGGSGVTVVYLK